MSETHVGGGYSVLQLLVQMCHTALHNMDYTEWLVGYTVVESLLTALASHNV